MNSIAKLKGLVLTGGQSLRMGKDKGLLEYFGKPHRIHVYQLLNAHCEEVYMSIREDQRFEIEENYKVIIDQNQYVGPFNGLMSAHMRDADAAWLVVACDLPLIDTQSIARLIDHRNARSCATAYKSPNNEFPEPLFAIWEPKGLIVAKQYLDAGSSPSLVKFLLKNTVEIVKPLRDDVLLNANSKQDYQLIIKRIKENLES